MGENSVTRSPCRRWSASPARVEGDVIETSQLFATVGDHSFGPDGFPPHPERFARLGFDLAGSPRQPDYA